MISGTFSFRPLSTIFIGVFLLSSCINSGFVIEAFYNRLDTVFIREFEKYAEFDKDQKAWIESSVTDFMVWHRSHQLPAYSAFILQIRDRVVLNPGVIEEDITWMMGRFLEIVDDGFKHFPFLKSLDLLQGLTDEQLRQISDRTDQEYEKYRERFEEGDRKKRKRGVDRASTFLKRIGLTITDEQKQIIADGLSERSGNYEEDLQVWYDWSKRLIAMMENRHQPGFRDEAGRQIAKYPRLMRIYRPVEWQHNYEVDRNTLLKLFRDLGGEQREEFAQELTDLSDLLGEMAARELSVS